MPRATIRPSFPLGSLTTDTLKTDDLLDAARDAILLLVQYGYAAVRPAKKTIREIENALEAFRVDDPAETAIEDAEELLDEATTFIDGHCPFYVYYGALEGDGADIGFWFASETFEEDRASGDVPDRADVSGSYVGPAVEVNDHGNVTLYYVARGRTVRVVWSIV